MASEVNQLVTVPGKSVTDNRSFKIKGTNACNVIIVY